MSSKGLKERPEESGLTPGWQTPEEVAPSVIHGDTLSVARIVGFAGLLLLAMGTAVLLAPHINLQSRVGRGWAIVFILTGVGGLLFHAAGENDVQYRRLYGVFGFAWLAAGVFFSLLPANSEVGSLFLPYGFSCLTFGLFFLLPFARNETEPQWYEATVKTLGGVGALLALAGFVGGVADRDFLLIKGLPLTLLGLCFLWAYVGQVGADSNRGYWTGLAIGTVGVLAFLVGLGRSLLPDLLYSWGWLDGKPSPYFIPDGLLLMTLGLVYGAFALGVCSESRLIVMTRRELASYFYSPIAYIVFLGVAAIGWYQYWQFLRLLIPEPGQRPAFDGLEPVVRIYLLSWLAIIANVFVVPVLTMRTFSEERRSGTLEVLFTAPVHDATVVLSKFFAAFLVYLLAWLPWALFLVDLRVEGGREFDYRPVISFYFALAVSAAEFISMGMFFSSLTRNQIAAAILAFVGMMVLTAIYFLGTRDPNSTWNVVFKNLSYIELWDRAAVGVVVPRYIIFHLSAAIFWLFLTTKVLEARKWS